MTGDPAPLAALEAHPDVARLMRSLLARPGQTIEPSGEDRMAAIALVLRLAVEERMPSEAASLEMLMIKRAELETDPWSGHVACPGGRMEPSDHDLAQTAVRETWEETGIDLARDGRIIGTLDDVSPRTPRLPPIIIRPFVALLKANVALARSSEVAEAFWVPLAALRERAAWGRALVAVRGVGNREEAVFLYGNYTVWGLTERVLRLFLERLDGG